MIYVSGLNAKLTIDHCIFQYNYARQGGAIAITENSNLIIANSVFKSNIATEAGGAILCVGSFGGVGCACWTWCVGCPLVVL